MVVYFDWKTVIYIDVCGKCRTQFMLPMKMSVTFTGTCANEIIPSINHTFVYRAKEECHVRIVYLIILFILNLYKINIVVEPGYIYLRQVVSLDKNFVQS